MIREVSMGLFRHLKELALKIIRSEDGVWDRPARGRNSTSRRIQHEGNGSGAEQEGGGSSLDETDEAAAAWTAMNQPDE
jgi:hypothetical protein